MKMNKNKNVLRLYSIMGLLILVVGFSKVLSADKRIIGILFGIGVSLFVSGISKLLVLRDLEKYPNKALLNKIEEADERNIQISNRAKAKAGQIQQWMILGIAYMLIFIDAPLWATATTVCVFLSFNMLSSYYMALYQKQM